MGYKDAKLVGFSGPLPVPYPLNVVKTIQCQAFRVRGEGGLRLYGASSWYMLDATVLVQGEGPSLYFTLDSRKPWYANLSASRPLLPFQVLFQHTFSVIFS